MNAEIFSEWFKQQGYPVFRTKSTYWHKAGPRVYQAFPYHWIIKPTGEETNRLLKFGHNICLRYSTPIESSFGQISYHAVLEDSNYGFENLGKWSRKNVRKGLKKCFIEPISFQRLANEGWLLQLDTLDRQGRKIELERSSWVKRCLVAGNLPGFEAWGAISGGKLAASVITFQMEDCAYMLYQQCLRQYLRYNANNALSFFVSRELMKRSYVKQILYGLHSLDAPASVDEFKFRMGYKSKPVRQMVVFHPWVEPFVKNKIHNILKRFQKKLPGNPILDKAEGMVRFYLQGKLPIEKQTFPSHLIEQR